ncbi:AAA family ATPase [Isoptericola chiayiensis]|nr:AAA family ATPase [Isoptericola chiayiensis]NOV99393.1 putative ATPase [Isoptericola chiayiensis]
MRLKKIAFHGFKRFSELAIENIPSSARLVILAGPNGSGKSSVFDGLKTWHWAHGGAGANWDESYGTKTGSEPMNWTQRVSVEFHEPLPEGQDERKKLVYTRSAFRNEADFTVDGISRSRSPLDMPRVTRLIDTDQSVSDNYRRLVIQTIDGLYRDDLPETMTRAQLRDRIIGKVRTALGRVFNDLQLEGIGGVTEGADSAGTFYFTKGESHRFLYKNLSAGEKACFDLILDTIIKADYFDNSIWCIDEPETHLNTRIQGALLETLSSLVPRESQLVLATHSIGFMRKAWEMAQQTPGAVTFIDMHGIDFDQSASIVPVQPSRDFWAKTLDVALGDLAQLMAPERVVLCEGRPPASATDGRAEFDAACYRKIFSKEFPETDFISAGNSTDVSQDRLEAGRAIQTIASGTELVRLVDRDLLSEEEVAEYNAAGVRVLGRRNIESYLMDDEVLVALCNEYGAIDRSETLIQRRDALMSDSIAKGNDRDDFKKIAGLFYTDIRRDLGISGGGSNWNAFATGTLASLLQPGMGVYSELKQSIFGE